MNCKTIVIPSSTASIFFLFLFLPYTFFFSSLLFKTFILCAYRYELFVGQPPFYTNSVYALVRHIVKVHVIKFICVCAVYMIKRCIVILLLNIFRIPSNTLTTWVQVLKTFWRGCSIRLLYNFKYITFSVE